MHLRIVSVACAVALVAGCGDPDPKEACNQLVESFASAWARCGKMTYEAAKQQFSSNFSSCNPSTVDQAKVDQCSSDLNSVDCSLINGNGFPTSCTNALK